MKLSRRQFSKAFGALAMCSAIAAMPTMAAQSSEALTIGLGGAVTTIDPHFYNATPNHVIAHSIFDRLVERDPKGNMVPGLAESWKPISDTVWEFKLRPDVKWHDGEPFTADDVVFTFTRALNVPNSPGGFGGFLRDIAKTERVDDLTLHLHTKEPAPNLPRQLGFVAIVSQHAGEGATTDQYNSGVKAIGTGPYKFKRYIPGDRVELERNDDWWGAEQPWKDVTIRLITNSASRVGALLSGEVDIIDAVPSTDLPSLEKNKDIRVASVPGMRLLYIALNQRDQWGAQWLTDAGGKALDENPMLDGQVREALSLAINREAIADRLLQKTAVATGQWLPEGSYSYADSVEVPSYDPEKAKALLAEAGYPKGFKLVLQTPNDRYPNDAGIAQAVAQMWSRIGVETMVDARPWNTYQKERADYVAALWGWGSPTLEAGYLLSNVLMTPDKEKGVGNFNYGGYSNPKLDQLTVKALSTLDDAQREKVLIEAVETAARDVPILPLVQLTNFWAMRKEVNFDARMDERTLPINVNVAE